MIDTMLTIRQRRFVEEYLIDLNGRQAAIRAGYKETTAHHQAARLLAHGDIAAAVSAGMRERSERTRITHDQVIAALARVAFSDIRKLFRPDGTMRPITELDAEAAAALAGFKVVENRDGDGVVVGYTREAKLADRLRALELLGKHLGMFNDRLTIQGDVENPIAVLVRQVQGSALLPVANPPADNDLDEAA